MTITDITFMHQSDGISSVTFGYRIDDGQGFGAWTGLQLYTTPILSSSRVSTSRTSRQIATPS